MQQSVVGQPSALGPTDSYVDIQKITDSLPKYKTWLNPESWTEWETLTLNFDKIYSEGEEDNPGWLLDTIIGKVGQHFLTIIINTKKLRVCVSF